ncbi:hypothetical protein P171DRAFT_94087 [Karstenula rhodostoma CBS 690.94]|uniref:Increased loss of mitochondrial DNA protein 1 n=1 Tax=Karstenula rhodostoma CBS 690.94 TaxID=1392251 RepID=A0A9P4PCA4_9PLEO|nr:hypothetical protein P171DRAFT_94087 [Karstenula rhodostoma CBS 690.94]
MAIFSAYTIIRALALFHVTLAVFVLRNPRIIAEQNIVFLLGEAMQLPTPREFLKPSAATGFIAVLLAFLGISDLTALSMSEEAVEAHWGTQTPVRLAFLFGLTGYAYAFKQGGVLGSTARGAGDHLKNSVVFAFGFVELTVWFWVFITLRDERRQRVIRLMERRRAEQDML